jgi:N-acetylmuramoyl-L-alanine amidase
MIPVTNYPSDNFNDRPEGVSIKYLIYHYTGGNLEESLYWLTKESPAGKVSSHYLICEKGEIYAHVPEHKRAWHAGLLSRWEDDAKLNAMSIGIELVNPGMGPDYRDFTTDQMKSLVELTKDILSRYNISPFHILGHSDIAPDRKVDPGDRFDWQGLALKGIGVYPDGITIKEESPISELQQKLKSYGYPITVTGVLDEQTSHVIRAFQLHFGYADLATISAKLDWLLSYRAQSTADQKSLLLSI